LASNGHSDAEPSAAIKPSDVLERAAALIEPPGAWTQGEYARNECGSPRAWDDPDAACFCARGAIYRASRSGAATRAHDAAELALVAFSTVRVIREEIGNGMARERI
jgi:hypothetical protein